jgi:uncharacterized membrane protein YfcA
VITALIGGVAVGLLLGLLGSGGSIATVPILVYGLGMAEKAAIAGSLAIVGSIALVGALRSKVEKRAVIAFGVPGMAGSFSGATLSASMAASTQMLLFAGVLGIAAVSMLMRRESEDDGGARGPAWKLVLSGLATGVLTGIVGVGGGFLIVPALVLFAGIPTRRAIGTSLAIITLQSFAGFARHVTLLDAHGVTLDYRMIAGFAALGMAGSVGGAALGRRLPQATLRRAFGGFVLIKAGVIAATSI